MLIRTAAARRVRGVSESIPIVAMCCTGSLPKGIWIGRFAIGSSRVQTTGATGEAVTLLGGTESTSLGNPLLQKSADADGIADATLAANLNVPCDAYDPQKPVAECMNSISA